MAEGIAFSGLGKLGGAVVEKIGGCLEAPIGRQYRYIFCLNSNLENLENQLKNLETTRRGVQMGVDQAKRSARVISPSVEAWLDSVNEVTKEVERIVHDKPKVEKGCFNGWCPNLKLRYSLSKKAVKKTSCIERLQAESINFNCTRLSYNPLPLGVDSIPSKEFKVFESRISTMNEIIDSLKNDEINLIGLCGMGGIGKTTMVYEVAKRVKEENLFHEVAIAVVKQQPDMAKIQGDIAEMLGLELDKDSMIVRAGLLRRRLLASEENKRILVILDDVWEEFDWTDLGIPMVSGREGCKTIYTSRNQDLWHDVRTKKEIPLELLSEDEAWRLFRERAGDSADAPDLQPIAKQIVNGCGRLPLALVIIGSALSRKSKGHFIKHRWEDMLDRLTCTSSASADKRLSSSLELSYSYLEDKEAKHVFLLCCLFEEDQDIPIEGLVRYGMGLSLFEGIDELGKVRHRVYALVEDLKSCYLILDSKADECVKVHDVVRDVGISIASRDKGALVRHGVVFEWPRQVTYEHCTCISLLTKETIELPQGLSCPILEFLMLKCLNYNSIPFNFFEGMTELRVAALRDLNIPLSSLQFLSNLRTLCLENIPNGDMSVTGELWNLEILSFRHSSILELPKSIAKLANLKLLDLTACRHLKTIPPGVISGLVKLEELYMRGSGFRDWEGEDEKKGKNVSLREFKFLSNLNTLEIWISDASLLPSIPIFSRLAKYLIVVDFSWSWASVYPIQRQLILDFRMQIPSACGGIDSLLKGSECVHLNGQGSKDLVHELLRDGVQGLEHLKALSIFECDTPECLANTVNSIPQANSAAPAVFPILDSLRLSDLPDLREICHSPVAAGSFGKLSSLQVRGCGKLGNLFQLSIVRCLTLLKRLSIISCDIMEEVFVKESTEDVDVATIKIEFPKLEFLKLEGLPRLAGFCRGIDGIEFPQLKELRLKSLPQLKFLFLSRSNLPSDSQENHSAPFTSLFPQKATFPNLEVVELTQLENLEGLGHKHFSAGSLSKLKEVTVRHCDKLVNVCPSELLSRLRNLDKFILENCSLLDVVFELEEVDCYERNSDVFSLTECLALYDLPKMNYISKRDPLGLKFIHTLDVCDCDSLRYVFSPTMTNSIPLLQELKIRTCKMMSRIVAEENGLGEKSVDEVEFPQLRILRLYDLPNLVTFFPRSIATVVTSTDHLHNTVQALFNEKVAFPCLEELELEGLHNVNQIWCSELSNCSFSKLKGLRVEDCGLIEEIFGFGNLNVNDEGGQHVKFTGLTSMVLSRLDKLIDICKTDHQGIPLENLTYLNVSCCASLRNMFSPSMARGLVHLEKLIINDCSAMEEVVAKQEKEQEEEAGQERRIDRTLFPHLRGLKLINLPKLRNFCHVIHPLELPLLGQMSVMDCPKMGTFSLGCVSTPKLRSVDIDHKEAWKGNLNKTMQLLQEEDEDEDEDDWDEDWEEFFSYRKKKSTRGADDA
ncbi:disease resistance protein At4g27190-like [Actinidia eriantha]|uniref:disease resistance protein At4g27190-like n=1 Tax=Actinidia eriantha TaxID=165200 RepID=UPI00258384A7|nr:disease resistance protein At4g27190-like [Actinidia eriantha]XP_057468367.1 disease resistance protein At4g27190-like [Actinidia eriantha]XP_057468368.1 disease resistance protein At4g27190-like [Actinidia eriantha]